MTALAAAGLGSAALARLAAAIDVATFEFENVPVAAIRRVAALTPVPPRPEILEIAQDRLRDKVFPARERSRHHPLSTDRGQGRASARARAVREARCAEERASRL
jgi:phosphoribosylaminoimidazole carboxylase (NCAIR synthetase)